MDNKAVSPVVGTILLIAITVALAAIVATLVSGLGGRGAPPSVMLTVTAVRENHSGENDWVKLTIAHQGGDDLNIKDLTVQATDNNGNPVSMTQSNGLLSLPAGATTLSVGGTMTAEYDFSTSYADPSNQTITVYVIHNPSKQKLFSSASIVVQPAV
jgi:flagellin-like protein